MAAGALALLALLAYPQRPAPLPSVPDRARAAQPAPQAASPRRTGTAASVAEVAALFSLPRAGPARAVVSAPARPEPPPERAPWLRCIAFAVGSDGRTAFFFKDGQSGRVLMLVQGQPKDGWNLAAIQGDAWVLENGGHRYLVTR